MVVRAEDAAADVGVAAHRRVLRSRAPFGRSVVASHAISTTSNFRMLVRLAHRVSALRSAELAPFAINVGDAR